MKANLDNERFFLRLVTSGRIQVTKSGRAFNLVTGNEIALSGASDYRKLSWPDKKTGAIRQIQLHRLIWAFFKGVPSSPELEINHKDGVKHNCRLTNLELVDSSTNTLHAHDTGLQPSCKGECNSQSKFRDSQIAAIRKRFALRLSSVEQIAARFDVSETTVIYLLSSKTYPHVVSGFEDACLALLSLRKQRVSDKNIAKVKRLRSLGFSSYAIAEKTGLARNTVMKYW